MTTPSADGMPTTRGTNFYLADPNLAFELDARPVADALYHASAGALSLKKWLRPAAPPASVFTARECHWLPALVNWMPVGAEALADPAGGC